MTEVQMIEDGDEIRFTVSEPEFDKFASDALQRLRDKQEEHLEEALKDIGWTSPDDLPAHDRKIAAEALREAADDLAAMVDDDLTVIVGDPGDDETWVPVRLEDWLDIRADRIEQGGDDV